MRYVFLSKIIKLKLLYKIDDINGLFFNRFELQFADLYF